MCGEVAMCFFFSHDVYKVNGQEKGDTLPIWNTDFFAGGGVWGGGDVFLFSHDVYKVNGQEKGDTLPGVTSMGVFSEYRSMFE